MLLWLPLVSLAVMGQVEVAHGAYDRTPIAGAAVNLPIRQDPVIRSGSMM